MVKSRLSEKRRKILPISNENVPTTQSYPVNTASHTYCPKETQLCYPSECKAAIIPTQVEKFDTFNRILRLSGKVDFVCIRFEHLLAIHHYSIRLIRGHDFQKLT